MINKKLIFCILNISIYIQLAAMDGADARLFDVLVDNPETEIPQTSNPALASATQSSMHEKGSLEVKRKRSPRNTVYHRHIRLLAKKQVTRFKLEKQKQADIGHASLPSQPEEVPPVSVPLCVNPIHLHTNVNRFSHIPTETLLKLFKEQNNPAPQVYSQEYNRRIRKIAAAQVNKWTLNPKKSSGISPQ